MKKLLIMFSSVVSLAVYSQTTQQDVALIQSFFGKQKQELVNAYMNMDENVAEKFWPLYDEYEIERQAVVRGRVESIINYSDKYGELNDESASKIMHSILDNDAQLVKLEEKYLKKMNKAVGGITAAKFFQLENYLRNLIFSKIEEQIPAIDGLK